MLAEGLCHRSLGQRPREKIAILYLAESHNHREVKKAFGQKFASYCLKLLKERGFGKRFYSDSTPTQRFPQRTQTSFACRLVFFHGHLLPIIRQRPRHTGHSIGSHGNME